MSPLRRLVPPQWRVYFGKRRQILLTMGLLWVLLGLGNFVEPPPPAWDSVPMLHNIPPQVFGWTWALTGLIAVAYAVRPHTVDRDGLGFLALYAMPAYSGAAFLISWIDYVTDSVGGPGYSRGWLSALVYVGIGVMVTICSDWEEPACTGELE